MTTRKCRVVRVMNPHVNKKEKIYQTKTKPRADQSLQWRRLTRRST